MFKKLRIALLLTAGIFAASAASAQGVPSLEAEVQVVGNQSLTRSQRDGFENFREQTLYYGAMYVASNGSFGWYRDLNSLEAAQTLAEASCERNAGRGQCAIYAQVVPKPIPGRQPFEGLAMSQAAEAIRWIRSQRGQTNAAVMASSPYWGYQATINSRGVRTAERQALNGCQRYLEERISDWLSPEEIELLRAADLIDCRVIVSIRGR